MDEQIVGPVYIIPDKRGVDTPIPLQLESSSALIVVVACIFHLCQFIPSVWFASHLK